MGLPFHERVDLKNTPKAFLPLVPVSLIEMGPDLVMNLHAACCSWHSWCW